MRLIGLDPGNTESAVVVWNGSGIVKMFQRENDYVCEWLRGQRHPSEEAQLIIEQVASFGMPVGEEVFETVFWSGRFAEAFGIERVRRLKRLDVKLALCHDSRAKDGNIRQALIDRFGHPGTKRAPGVLHGVSKDLWSALAVAVAWEAKQNGEQERITT
jgi:hypothetical protein